MITTNQDGSKFIAVGPCDTEAQIVREMTELALETHHWNKAAAARQLGVTRTCILARAKLWGLKKPEDAPEHRGSHHDAAITGGMPT